MPKIEPEHIRRPELTGSGVGWVSSTPKSDPTGRIAIIENPVKTQAIEVSVGLPEFMAAIITTDMTEELTQMITVTTL